MKIAFVTAFFPPNNIGGAEISSYYLSKVLADKGHEVHVIAPTFGKDKECREFQSSNQNLHIHRLFYPFRAKNDVLIMRLLTYNPFYIILLSLKILKIVKKYNIDIIHANQNEDNIPSWIASWMSSRPLIITFYDLRFVCEQTVCTEKGEIKSGCGFLEYVKCDWKAAKVSRYMPVYFVGTLYLYVYMVINKIILKKDKSFIAISYFLKDLAIKNKLCGTKIDVIYQITSLKMEVEEMPMDLKDSKLISFAGRLEPAKGVHVLIEAFNLVRKKINSRLFIIGDGSDKYIYYMKNLVQELNLENDVVFLGRLSNPKVLGIFKRSDVVAVPSIWPEAQGRTVMEALYVRTPVIASDVGGIKELINQDTGLLVKPGDKEALAEGIIKILLNPPAIENFKLPDPDCIYRQTIIAYKEVSK